MSNKVPAVDDSLDTGKYSRCEGYPERYNKCSQKKRKKHTHTHIIVKRYKEIQFNRKENKIYRISLHTVYYTITEEASTFLD